MNALESVSDLRQRLDAYPSLSRAEREAVEREVSSHPDLADRLADARALAAVLDAAGTDGDAETRLAQALVDERLGIRTEPVETDDPSLREAAGAMRTMLDRVEAEGESPLAQFERLTGHTLAPAPAERRRSDDRPAAAPPRGRSLRRVSRFAVVAALFGVFAYGSLFAASSLVVPESTRVADLETVVDRYRPVVTRGATVPLADRYAAALQLIEEARHTTLGLFPTYDEATLDRAAGALGAIRADADPASTIARDATLALARIRIVEGRTDDARSLLETVAQDPQQQEAGRLLQWIETTE